MKGKQGQGKERKSKIRKRNKTKGKGSTEKESSGKEKKGKEWMKELMAAYCENGPDIRAVMCPTLHNRLQDKQLYSNYHDS